MILLAVSTICVPDDEPPKLLSTFQNVKNTFLNSNTGALNPINLDQSDTGSHAHSMADVQQSETSIIKSDLVRNPDDLRYRLVDKLFTWCIKMLFEIWFSLQLRTIR